MIKIGLLSLQNFATPLGLGYLISWYNKYSKYKDEVEFKIVEIARDDGQVLVAPHEIVKSLVDFDVVGITTITQDHMSTVEVCDLLYKKNIHVILGGHHVSALPDKLPKSSKVGVIGEGEITFQELIDLYVEKGGFPKDNLANIDGICFHTDDGGVAKTKARARILDADSIPPPDREYYDQAHFIPRFRWKNKVVGSILTSRGCPYLCVFCSSSAHWTRLFKYFSAEYVVDEMIYLHKKYDVTIFQIFDDLGTVTRKRWEKIRDLLKEKGYLGKFEFHAQCRADIFDEEVCRLFKELNFTELEFGIEAGTQETLNYLKNVKKNIQGVEHNWRAINLCLKYNMNVWVQLIVGSPNETIEDVKETLRFTEIPGVRSQVCLLTPLPGTPLWEDCLRKGLVSNDMDWSRLHLELNDQTFFNRIYVNEKIHKKELWNLIKVKLESNVVTEVNQIELSFKTFYNMFKLLAHNPRTYSRIYSRKLKLYLLAYMRKFAGMIFLTTSVSTSPMVTHSNNSGNSNLID